MTTLKKPDICLTNCGNTNGILSLSLYNPFGSCYDLLGLKEWLQISVTLWHIIPFHVRVKQLQDMAAVSDASCWGLLHDFDSMNFHIWKMLWNMKWNETWNVIKSGTKCEVKWQAEEKSILTMNFHARKIVWSVKEMKHGVEFKVEWSFKWNNKIWGGGGKGTFLRLWGSGSHV